MADTDPTPSPAGDPTPDPTAAAAVTPTPPRRKRRRWLRVVLLLLVLGVGGLLLLVALAPTLLSTRPVVNLALKQVNQRLNGRVEVAGVSLGWTTGIKIDGLRVFDAAGVLVAQADHVACPMPLYKAIGGSFPLGHTVVDGLAVDAKYDSQGRLNLAQLAKAQPASATPPKAEPEPAQPGQPSKLPDVSGDLELTNARGTISRPGQPTVYLTSLAASVKIPSINDPITDHVTATAKVGEQGPEGKLVLDGTAAAIHGNRVALDSAVVHQSGDLTGLALAALKPFVAGLDTLDGVVDGHLKLDVPDGKSATLDANLTATQKVVAGGPLLHGDTFSTGTLTAAVPKLSAAFPDGMGHWQSGRVKVGTDGGEPILFKIDQGQLTLLVDAVPQALLNLKDHKSPGTDGRVELKAHFDAGQIAGQLKNTAKLSDDVALTGGTLDQLLTLVLSADKGVVTATTDLANVAGTRGGQPVSIQPVHLAVGATDLGGANVLDGLRDLSLKLSSKFATADFHGSDIGNLAGTLTAQLQQLQAELAQFHDFAGTKLAGDLTVKLANTGQLAVAPHQAKVSADVLVVDLAYGNAQGPVVQQPRVKLTVTGDLHGSVDEKVLVEQAKNLLLTLQAGSADATTLDVALEVPTATLGDAVSADFKLTKLTADLPTLQKQFANQLPYVVAGGKLTGTAVGHYAKDGVRLDPTTLTLAKLTVQHKLADNGRVTAVTDDTVNVNVAGTVGLGTTKTVDLSSFAIADTAHLFDVHKGDGPLTLTKSDTATGGKGSLAVAANLGGINDVVRKLGQTELSAPTPAGRVKSGDLTGTLTFNAAAGGKTDVVGDFVVPNLDVATATGGTGPQKATVTVRAASENNVVTADEVSFKSSFATLAVTKAKLLLSAKSQVNKLQSASLAVDVPDLKSASALLNAFSTPKPAPPAKAGETPAEPTPPLVVTAGSMSIQADVSHDGNNLVLSVPTVKADNVAFTRGKQSYQSKPITAAIAARVGTVEGEKLTMAQQLRDLSVTQLDANVGVATVALTKPITVADLSNPANASGGIKVDGDLGDIGHFLAAYGAKPDDAYPYRGHLAVVQNLTGDANSVALAGTLTVDKLQVMQGEQVQFAEDQFVVANDVALPADMNAVGIRTLTVDMKSSGALNVAVANGRIDDLAKQRVMKLSGSYKYDLAKLWPIVHPMLVTPGEADDYADVKIAGVFTRTFAVNGSYPAGVPFNVAVRPLAADFGLAVESFEHSGITVKNLDVPVTIRNGRATTTDSAGNAAPVATANDGQLDLGHLSVDLTQTPMRLSTPANKPVLTNVSINPLFTRGILGKVVNNPVFVGAQQATGLLSLSFDSCDRLPLGGLVKQDAAANDGTAQLKFSLTKLHIGVPGLAGVSDALNSDSFETQVKDGTVAIARGVETQQIAFASGPYTFGFNGKVRLADDAFVPMTVTVPLDVILKKQSVDANLRKYMPDTVPIALRGTASHPQLAADEVIGSLVQQAGQKAVQNGAGDLLGKALGGGKGDNGNGGIDPGKALGDLFGGGKKKGK